MNVQEKVKENRVRRRALRLGLLLRKSRAKQIHLDNLGDFMVIDGRRNFVRGGSRFDWSLDDVEEYLDEVEAELRAA